MAVLRKAKDTFPKMRLGQIIANAAPDSRDIFYLSCTEMTDSLIKFMKEMTEEMGKYYK